MGLSLLRRKQMGLWVQQMLSSLPLKIFLKKSFLRETFESLWGAFMDFCQQWPGLKRMWTTDSFSYFLNKDDVKKKKAPALFENSQIDIEFLRSVLIFGGFQCSEILANILSEARNINRFPWNVLCVVISLSSRGTVCPGFLFVCSTEIVFGFFLVLLLFCFFAKTQKKLWANHKTNLWPVNTPRCHIGF